MQDGLVINKKNIIFDLIEILLLCGFVYCFTHISISTYQVPKDVYFYAGCCCITAVSLIRRGIKNINIWIVLLFITLFGMSSQANCQQATDKFSPYQYDFSTIINRVKSYSPEDFTFSVSMPSLVDSLASGWRITYYVFVNDTIIQEFCFQPDAKKYIPELVALMNEDQYSWQVNIMLYSITQMNAIELIAYLPNQVDAWTRGQKDKDISFWKSYLTR